MSRTDKNQLRNNIIATVVSAIIVAGLGSLWAPTRALLQKLLDGAAYAVGLALADYSAPGWLLLVLVLISLASLVHFCVALRRAFAAPQEPAYVNDSIHGANWHWSWHDGHITNLVGFCPTCSAEIVYLHDPDNGFLSVPRAQYYCENCRKVVSVIEGGGHDYAIKALHREIRRRLRVSQPTARGTAS